MRIVRHARRLDFRLDALAQRECATKDCSRAAVGCDECRRALALKSFAGISRHPEAGVGCLVCEDGLPSWCAECLLRQVVEYRGKLRDQGMPIGRWPDYPDLEVRLPTLPGPVLSVQDVGPVDGPGQ